LNSNSMVTQHEVKGAGGSTSMRRGVEVEVVKSRYEVVSSLP
jgi:hypothetical protein